MVPFCETVISQKKMTERIREAVTLSIKEVQAPRVGTVVSLAALSRIDQWRYAMHQCSHLLGQLARPLLLSRIEVSGNLLGLWYLYSTTPNIVMDSCQRHFLMVCLVLVSFGFISLTFRHDSSV